MYTYTANGKKIKENYSASNAPDNKKSKTLMIVLIVIAVLFVIGCIVAYYMYNKPQASSTMGMRGGKQRWGFRFY
jgi:flagellar basal body-associated protein FliL